MTIVSRTVTVMCALAITVAGSACGTTTPSTFPHQAGGVTIVQPQPVHHAAASPRTSLCTGNNPRGVSVTPPCPARDAGRQ